jgi:hypothetical protein
MLDAIVPECPVHQGIDAFLRSPGKLLVGDPRRTRSAVLGTDDINDVHFSRRQGAEKLVDAGGARHGRAPEGVKLGRAK